MNRNDSGIEYIIYACYDMGIYVSFITDEIMEPELSCEGSCELQIIASYTGLRTKMYYMFLEFVIANLVLTLKKDTSQKIGNNSSNPICFTDRIIHKLFSAWLNIKILADNQQSSDK
jgi:hypothetical protein